MHMCVCIPASPENYHPTIIDNLISRLTRKFLTTAFLE